MKNTIKVLGIITFALIIGFLFLACPEPDSGSKSSSVSLNKTALEDKIADAEAEKVGVTVAAHASEVPAGIMWVTEAAMTNFDNAIETAKTVLEDAKTQSNLNTAVTTLNSAITTFRSLQSPGTFVIDTTNLSTKITEAEGLKDLTFVGTAASEVPQGAHWVTQGVMDTFITAIDTAKGILSSVNPSSTEQSAIDSAVSVLESAIAAFNTAITANGTGTKTSGFTSAQVNTLITQANADKAGVPVKTNGDDVSPLAQWVSQSALDTFSSAITALQSASEQTAIDNAYLALITARETFSEAKTFGTSTGDVKETLEEAIENAESAKEGIKIAASAAEAPYGESWANTTQMNALNTVITAVTNIYTNLSATKNEVNTAITTLDAAITTFNNAVAANGPGTKPEVTNVTVTPSTLTIGKGQSHTFTAVVTGYGEVPQTVTWSIHTTKHAQTTISQSGVLTVSQSETQETITVRAASTSNIGIHGDVEVNVIWIDPATQTTLLTGEIALTAAHGGNNALPQTSPYGFEIFMYEGGGGAMAWYGPDQGGGGAFKATWDGYYLARIGYYWGNGGAYTQYNNIYADYNFTRTANNTSHGGFIGVYGWSRNPSAAKEADRLIEYYIVDDWFSDFQLQMFDVDNPHKTRELLGSFEVDGAEYIIVKTTRTDESIDGTKLFTQILSIRQGRRTYGTISVTEHFKAWSKYLTLGNMYEAKFKVESFGGNGTLDLRYMYMSQEQTRRSIPEGTTPVDFGNNSEKGIVGVQVLGEGFAQDVNTGIITFDSKGIDASGVIAIPVPADIRTSEGFIINFSDITVTSGDAKYITKVANGDSKTIADFSPNNFWDLIADPPNKGYPYVTNATIASANTTVNLAGVTYKNYIFLQHNNTGPSGETGGNSTAKYSFKIDSVIKAPYTTVLNYDNFTGVQFNTDAPNFFDDGSGIQRLSNSDTWVISSGAIELTASGNYSAVRIQTGTGAGGTNYYTWAPKAFNAAAGKTYRITVSASSPTLTKMRIKVNNSNDGAVTSYISNLSSTPTEFVHTWTQASLQEGGNVDIDNSDSGAGKLIIHSLKIEVEN